MKNVELFGTRNRRFCAIAIAALIGFSMLACDTGTGSDAGGLGGLGGQKGGGEPIPSAPASATAIAAKLASLGNINNGNGAVLVTNLGAAKPYVFPIIKLLGKRHDEMDDAYLDEMEDAVENEMRVGGLTSKTFSYDAALFPLSAKIAGKLAGYGISAVKGAVAGSATNTSDAANRNEVFAFDTIDLEYSYDSATDSRYHKPAGTFVRGWVKAAGKTTEEERENKAAHTEYESEEEAMAITFVIAFNDGVNSGKIAAELGYSYKEVEQEIGKTDTEGYEYGPDLSAKFTFYDDAGNVQGEPTVVTEQADLRRIFKFWDID